MQTTYAESSLPATKTTRNAARLDFLDALRGIAALLVVVQHVGERYTAWIPKVGETWFNCGRFGVVVFFLVSGFVIPYAFEKDNSVRSFWIKRVFRLYPLYWLSLALTLAAGIEPSDFFNGQHVVRNALMNVTMLQGFVGVPNASAPYWTLFIEMAFYIAFTLWFSFRWHQKTMMWACVGVAGFLAVSVLAPLLLGVHAPVTKVFCFVSILVGSVWYRHFKGQASAGAVSMLVAAVLLLAGAGAYLNFYKFPSSEHISATAVFLSWAAAFLLFLLAYSFRRQNFPGVLTWLGKISYSLYLLHAVVLDIMPDLGSRSMNFIAVVGLSLCASTLSFRYLERPLVSIGHRLAVRLATT